MFWGLERFTQKYLFPKKQIYCSDDSENIVIHFLLFILVLSQLLVSVLRVTFEIVLQIQSEFLYYANIHNVYFFFL